jgi:predicted nucleic acid-binding protein
MTLRQAQGGRYIVVDASVWVARLVQQDVFHEPVKVWMAARRVGESTFISPSLLLAEVAGAVSRRTGDPTLARRAVRRLESLPGLRLVEMDNSFLRKAADLAAKLGLRGADSTYVALANRLDLPLVTLDADQRERAGKRIHIQSIETP